jgi:hypothetical protein
MVRSKGRTEKGWDSQQEKKTTGIIGYGLEVDLIS